MLLTSPLHLKLLAKKSKINGKTFALNNTEAYYCHPHVKILTCHVNIIRNQKAICWHVGIV